MTASPPIAIPAIAPAGNPLLCEGVVVEDGAAVAVSGATVLDEDVKEILVGAGVADCSGGKSSPGWSMYDEFCASCRCVARLTEELGLITATMPCVIHAPGAEQYRKTGLLSLMRSVHVGGIARIASTG